MVETIAVNLRQPTGERRIKVLPMMFEAILAQLSPIENDGMMNASLVNYYISLKVGE